MADGIEINHNQGTHHWSITLDQLGSYSGTCTPLPAETRYDLYLRIRSEVLEEAEWRDGPVPVTLFFDAQPNTLDATEES